MSGFLKNIFCYCDNSNILCPNLCSKLALIGSRSKACRSLNFICETYHFSKLKVAFLEAYELWKPVCMEGQESIDLDIITSAGIIQEMI